MIACGGCGGVLESSLWLVAAGWTAAGTGSGLAWFWLWSKIRRKSCRP